MTKILTPVCWGVALSLAFLALDAMALKGTSRQSPRTLQGNAENGKELFTNFTCFGCHGYTGETGRGPRLNPPRLNQDRFITYLRNPPNPRQMPPYRQAEVSDQKLADIYAFLESLPSGSPDAEDIPTLREILDESPR